MMKPIQYYPSPNSNKQEVNLGKQHYRSTKDEPQHPHSVDPKGSGDWQEVVVEKPSRNKKEQGSEQSASSTPLTSQDSTGKQEPRCKEQVDPEIQLVKVCTNPQPVSLENVYI